MDRVGSGWSTESWFADVSCGTAHAARIRVTFTHYRELACWQLSTRLRDELISITARSNVKADFEFCDQLAGAARSAPSNIAEGFGRSNPEFSKYLVIAMGSLREVENHLDEANVRKYVSADEHARFRRLAKRAHCAAAGLLSYLRRRRAKRTQPDRTRSNPI